VQYLTRRRRSLLGAYYSYMVVAECVKGLQQLCVKD
jgi:hypothetical protein